MESLLRMVEKNSHRNVYQNTSDDTLNLNQHLIFVSDTSFT